MSWLLFLVLALPLLWATQYRQTANKKNLPFPPGPKGSPVLGCLLRLPPGKPWLIFDNWVKEYGDIMSFNLAGRRFIVLGSTKRAEDLFTKRSANYAHKQKLSFLLRVVGLNFVFALRTYDPRWRKDRRLFQDFFHANLIKSYHPVQLREARALARNLLTSPEKFRQHIPFCLAATIMSVVYDIRIQGLDNPHVIHIGEVMRCLGQGVFFGRFWVDYAPFMIPIMEYVPSWVPGAGYKVQAEKWRKAARFVENVAFDDVKKDLAKGISRPCITTSILESITTTDEKERAEAETIARDTVATSCLGAADTTVSSTLTFFLAILNYPDVLKKAHAELDRVVGRDRLPDAGDKESLPYINAIVKEVNRWQLIVPSSIHTVGEDDEYDGYFIPKGSVVVGNSWSILHDPEVYPEPEEFRPERFLADGDKNPAPDPIQAFGYGRRLCPGRFFAHDSLFIIFSTLLAAFDITPPIDDHGNPVAVKIEYQNGSATQPAPFECIIKPRSPLAESLVKATEIEYEAAL